MSAYCKSCGGRKPREAFTGRGYRSYTCKKCGRLPGGRRARQDGHELWDYLRQSHISAKNMARLGKLASSPDSEIAEMARVTLEVAQVTPYKGRRLKILARRRRDLLDDLRRTGLIDAHHW